MNNQNQDNLTEEELVDILKFQGKKLANLLYDSNMPEDIKESWIAMLPEMSPEQISRFIDILEAKYLDEATRDIDEKFKKELEVLVEKYQAEDKEQEIKIVEAINNISLTI